MLCSQIALSGYSIMWLYVMFDLPTDTKGHRREATIFRKRLLEDGFVMYQFSVYIRSCPSLESTEVHVKRIKRLVPKEGLVSILKVTDRQYGDTINIFGGGGKELPTKYEQMEFL